MGSDRHYPEEAPAHDAEVRGFWMDRTSVTNRDFAAFVQATGYRTVAELPPDPRDYPGADPASLTAGAIVFCPPAQREGMRFWGDWWSFVPGAQWRFPAGTHQECHPDHPVVQVAYADAASYAAWSGKTLPTEAEWEFAARSGLADAEFAWGSDLTPDGTHMANTWQGRFPLENLVEDGHAGTSPVDAYPPNAFGLSDMIGNVWEWTADLWLLRRRFGAANSCCTLAGSHVYGQVGSRDVAQPAAYIRSHVIKGGSHLCAPSYCRRYRPSARQPQMIDSGTTHIGFRCASRVVAV